MSGNPVHTTPKLKPIGNDGTVFRCPMCKTTLSHADVKSFPFCSDRCRLLDLNNWIEGKYNVSRPIDPTDQIEDLPRRVGDASP